MTFPQPARDIIARLENAGYEAWVVGGAVRDAYLAANPIKTGQITGPLGRMKSLFHNKEEEPVWGEGVDLHDIDFATNARPQEVETVFSDCKTVDVGKSFGTIKVVWKDLPYEITTYRSEEGYRDGRHPDRVTYADKIEEDLLRRDFTMNAMAYHPESGLLDPFDGREDLKKSLLRAVGNPEDRIEEDGLRMLRAVRFAARLGLTLESHLQEAIENHKEDLNKISMERCLEEMTRMLMDKSAGRAMEAMENLGLLQVLIPEIDLPLAKQRYDFLPPEDFYRWACLLSSVSPKQVDSRSRWAKKILKRFKSSNELQNRVALLLREDLELPKDLPHAQAFVGDLGDMATPYLLFRKSGPDAFRERKKSEIGRRRGPGSRLENYREEIIRAMDLVRTVKRNSLPTQISDLSIGGRDLMDLGYNQGRQIGETLEELLNLVIEGELENTREALMAHAKKARGSSDGEGSIS